MQSCVAVPMRHTRRPVADSVNLAVTQPTTPTIYSASLDTRIDEMWSKAAFPLSSVVTKTTQDGSQELPRQE